MAMLSVDEALSRVLASVAAPTHAEEVAIEAASGRTLARDLASRRMQPPFPASAMDGYAVRAGDVCAPPAALSVIGRSVAGRGFDGRLGAGEAADDGSHHWALVVVRQGQGDGLVAVAQHIRPRVAGRPVSHGATVMG